jgi:gliding motility-associated lipoprotein GldD
MTLKKNNVAAILFFVVISAGCRDIAVPRPKGYFRIDLPARDYVLFSDPVIRDFRIPLSFEYPGYGNISSEADVFTEPGWFNIDFPKYNARIYLTYRKINNDLESLMEQSYRMNVKNHIIKADAINEMTISKPENNVYGILYDLKGNTATAVQFFVTDSVKHFLRGSLYFSSEPNSDSLAPVIEFFRDDIVHLVETLKWKE